MKFRLYILSLLLLTCFSSWAQDGSSWWNTDYNTTEGTEFWVTFMRNAGKGKYDNDLFLRLFASARQDADVWVCYNADTTKMYWQVTDSILFHIPAGKQEGLSNEKAVPNVLAYIEDINDKYKGIYIHSSTPISLYALNYFQDSYDATLVYPVSALYREYVVQTYKKDHSATEFVIVATENNTNITIFPRESGVQKAEITITLDKGNTYIYRSSNSDIDLSGTYICSTKPIGVFHGNQDAFVPAGTSNGPANHLYEQSPSTDFLGKNFIASRTANQERDIIRFTAVEDNTKIYINGTLYTTLKQYETAELNIKWLDYPNNSLSINASKMIYCGLYLTSFNANRSTMCGAPTLTTLTPLELAIHSTIIGTFPFRSEMSQTHYVNIVVPTEALSTMKMDGKVIDANLFQELSFLIDGVQYSSARIEVSSTAHVLDNTKAPFVCHVYGIAHYEDDDGNASDESYAYSGGSNTLHPMWMLIDGERTDSVSICEDNGPVTFTSVINFDYTDVRWEFHTYNPNSYYPYSYKYKSLEGKTQVIHKPKIKKRDNTKATGDSVITKKYDDIPRYRPLREHIDTIYMIVSRQTPICDYTITDTVKAIVQVNDTFRIDENKEKFFNPNVCYGDSFMVHLQGKEYGYLADTSVSQIFNKQTFKLQLDSAYTFADSLLTIYDCDSVINQVRIIRPTYDTTIYDTLCYTSLPYRWTDQSSRISFYITEKNLKNHSKFPITKEKEFYVDSIIKDTTLQTIYGCDSVVHIHWLVLPNYELTDKKEVCADSLHSYTEWAGHVDPKTGKPLTNHYLQKKTYFGWEDIDHIDMSEHGTFTYRDNLTTKNHRCKTCHDNLGCDSTWILTLKVKDYVNITMPTQTICDDDNIFWEGKYRLGPKCLIPTDGKPSERYYATTTLTSVHPASNPGICDSTYNMRLVINPTYRDTIDTTICYNQLPFVWVIKDTKGVNTKATFQPQWSASPTHIDSTYILSTRTGCDSIVTLHLHIYPTYQDTIDTIICQATQGTLDYTMHNPKGVFSVNSKKWVTTIPLDKAGQFTYIDSLKTTDCAVCNHNLGCDSVWVLRLTVHPNYDFIDSRTLCENDTIHWHGKVYVGGKASADKAAGNEKHYWAEPQWTTSMPQDQYRSPKTYRDIQHIGSDEKLTDSIHLHTIHGCDSIYWLRLTVNPTYEIYKYDTVCSPTQTDYNFDGLSVHWNHIGDTIYTKALTTSSGCDSIVHLSLHIDSAYHFLTSDTICDTEPYSWQGHNYTRLAGGKWHSFWDSLSTQTGCDSVYQLRLYVAPSYSFPREERHLCVGAEGSWRKKTFSNLPAGVYTYYDSLQTVNFGCDSVYSLTLYVDSTTHDSTELQICDNEQVTHEGTTYKGNQLDPVDGLTPGIHHFDLNLKSQWGCDSVVALTVVVHLTYRNPIIYDTICESALPYHYADSRAPRLQNLTKTGTYSDTLSSIYGCDSIITLHLQVWNTTIHEYNQLWCHSAGVFHYGEKGKTATTSGVYRDTLITRNSHGCDSIEIVHLEVLETLVDVEYDTICENEHEYNHWDVRATRLQHLTKTGTYYDTLKSVTDCDSIIELHLHVWQKYELHDYDTICDNQEYNYNGHIFKNLAVQNQPYDLDTMLQSIHGCDSLVHFHLTVHPTFFYENTRHISDKDSVHWIKNGKDTVVYGENSPYKPQSVKGLVAQPSAYFYPDSLSTIHGCDSVWHKFIYVRPTFVQHDTDYVCQYEYDNYTWDGHTSTAHLYDEQGQHVTAIPTTTVGTFLYVDSLQTVNGDDSLFILHLVVHPVYKVNDPASVCEDSADHHFNWITEDTYGTYSHTLSFPAIEAKDAKGTIKDTLFRTMVDTLHTIYGCDSVVTLQLTIYPTYSFTQDLHVCQDTIETLWEWVDEQGGSQGFYPRNHVGEFTYGKNYSTIHGCDSVFGIKLIVDPIYRFDTLLTICANDSVSWQNILFVGNEFANFGKTYNVSNYDSVRANMSPGEYISVVRYNTRMYGCDSTYIAHIVVNPIYRTTIQERTCQTTEGYYYKHLNNGIGGVIPAAYLSDSLTRNDTIPSITGCDSIITLHFTVDSVYRYTQKDSTCQVYGGTWVWKNKFGDPQETISIDVGDTTIYRGTTYHTIHGCDSTFGVELYIKPIYHFYDTLSICESDSISWQGLWFSGKQFRDYNPSGFDASVYRRSQADLAQGQHKDTAWYKTYLGCDSIYHLVLTIHAVPHVAIDRRICQSKDNYWYECENRGKGGYLPSQRVGTYTYVDTIQTVLGCDSIVTLTFHVDSVYDYRQQLEVCQDTANFQWEWIDDEDHSHGYIDISEAGDFSFEEKYTTIYGCDSVYGLQLRVKPIYRFDSTYHICENERVTWQYKTFTGDSALITPEDSIILPSGTYYDTAHYLTREGCDSTYYLVLHVHAIYDTLTIATTCANEGYVWHQSDYRGQYHDTLVQATKVDTVHLLPYKADIPVKQLHKDTTMFYAQKMLHSVHGCDSLSRLQLTIHPSYFFYSDTTICSNERLVYRGKTFRGHDTLYTEYQQTKGGCDSIYQLHLHVKPAYLFSVQREICDNETLIHYGLHEDAAWVVWTPGQPVQSEDDTLEIERRYITEEGCDSTYLYLVVVHPTYSFADTIDLCSNSETRVLDGDLFAKNYWYSWEQSDFERAGHPHIVSSDTLLNKHYTTIHGCDSDYQTLLHIHPAYKIYKYDTICSNQTYYWRGHHYQQGNDVGDYFPSAGDFYYSDVYTTTQHACDSIYELYLHVKPAYDYDIRPVICENELPFVDGDILLDTKDLQYYVATEPAHHCDSTFYFYTVEGCDSIVHVFLSVKDTTYEVRYDTICDTDPYYFYDKVLYDPGVYKYTDKNAWGCDHYVYLHLTVIPPTKYSLRLPEICADEDYFEIAYDYDHSYRALIEYSVYFDSLGHAQGFEDIDHAPISDMERQIITVPVPHLHDLPQPNPIYFETLGGQPRYVDTIRKSYPQPDSYHIRVIMHNGICSDRLQAKDTIFDVLYPAWIHEQHWNDGIVLFNSIYNGGYEFDKYQWYYNDQPIIGQTREFLYWPDTLDLNGPGDVYTTPQTKPQKCYSEYRVKLTRKGETKGVFTCPICPIYIYDKVVPQEDFFAVVPTLIVRNYPYVWILSTKPVYYRAVSPSGDIITQGFCALDRDHYEQKIYLGPITTEKTITISLSTTDGEQRSFKVLVVSGN